MSGKRILAITAMVVAILNAAIASGTGIIPPKYALAISGILGLAQGFLPRAQGSTAHDNDGKQ